MKVLRDGASEGVLDRAETARAIELIAAVSADAAAERYGLKPQRARILPAGAVIVDAILRRFGANSLRVSDAGIREGALLVAAHAGRGWRDHCPISRTAGASSRYSPATTRPSARRNGRPATPRQGRPKVRRRRATSRSRLTR